MYSLEDIKNINSNGFNNSISNELLKIKVMNRLKSFAGDY